MTRRPWCQESMPLPTKEEEDPDLRKPYKFSAEKKALGHQPLLYKSSDTTTKYSTTLALRLDYTVQRRLLPPSSGEPSFTHLYTPILCFAHQPSGSSPHRVQLPDRFLAPKSSKRRSPPELRGASKRPDAHTSRPR